MKPLKVSMTISFDVDVDAWAHEYGQDPADIREDVKSYFETMLHGSYPATENLVVVNVKN